PRRPGGSAAEDGARADRLPRCRCRAGAAPRAAAEPPRERARRSDPRLARDGKVRRQGAPSAAPEREPRRQRDRRIAVPGHHQLVRIGGQQVTHKIAVVSAGLSDPSSTRMLADKLVQAVFAELDSRGVEREARVFELRDVAHDITNNLLTGFAPKPLAEMNDYVANADAVIAVTPIFSTSYSGLFKSWLD